MQILRQNCPHKKDVDYKIDDFFIHPEFDFPFFDVAIYWSSKLWLIENLISIKKY